MRIAQSQISLAAQHTLVERHVQRETLQAGVSRDGTWQPDALSSGGETTVRQTPTDSSPEPPAPRSLLGDYLGGRTLEQVTAAHAAASPAQQVSALTQRQQAAAAVPASVEGTAPFDLEPGPRDRALIQLIVATIEKLSGRRLKLLGPDELRSEADGVQADAQAQAATDQTQAAVDQAQIAARQAGSSSQPAQAEAQPAAPAAPAWGLRYTYEESHYEAEATTFSAQGVVRTQDGQEVDVNVELSMSRQFASEQRLEVNAGAAVHDPLVVNFAGTAAELTQTQYRFDLDSSGQADQIHFVGPGSGFLALDANDNGAVDDGGELFGPTTGDGFAELAGHDGDGNAWIDEADPVYERLRIWSRDADGNEQLVGLGQRGVGAIYLGHATTPFQVKDAANQLQAQVRSTGIYVSENGAAGTVQQLDLVA